MKILHLYKDYYPVLGGIENHIKALAEAHAAAGHDVTVLVCNPGLRTRTGTTNGVRVISAGRLTTRASMPISFAQPWILARQRPDIVHVHSPYPLGEVANLLLNRRCPTVLTHHSDVVRQRMILKFYGPLLRQVLDSADRIVATSPRYIESSPWLSPVREKCSVIPLGVDIGRFRPAPKPYAGPFTLLFVGKLRWSKGLDAMLRALFHLPQVHLTIVGDGPMRGEWQALCRELGLTGRATFVGDIDDAALPEYYHKAHAFVLPSTSRAEAFGMVLQEAMASGLPCITTELGSGNSWIVNDGVTGLVVPPNDPKALASAVAALQTDPEGRERMGRAGLERVKAGFTRELMIHRTMRLYEELT